MLSPRIRDTIGTLARTRPERSFYLYDPQVMAQKIATLKARGARGRRRLLCHEGQSPRRFLETARHAGVEGVEIASIGEGQKALSAGFAPGQIIFTGPGKSPEELEWSVSVGIRTIHVESLTEAHRLNAIAAALGRRQDILVRVNPNFHIHGAQANFSGDSSKLGMDEQKFRAALPEILALRPSPFPRPARLLRLGRARGHRPHQNCELVFALAAEIESQYQGVSCPVIDFGGGFGIDYLDAGPRLHARTLCRTARRPDRPFRFRRPPVRARTRPLPDRRQRLVRHRNPRHQGFSSARSR